MATKKDLVEAHAFSRRRLVTAFVSGAPGGREVEPVRPGRVLIGGIALSVLLLAGAAIAGFLLGRPPAQWLEAGSFIISKDTGEQYVVMRGGDDPQLQRVPNFVSAQLLLRQAELTPFTVRDKYIRTVQLGEDLGIEGAPAWIDVMFGGFGANNTEAGADIIDYQPRTGVDPAVWFTMVAGYSDSVTTENTGVEGRQHHHGTDWQYGGWDRDVLQGDVTANGPNSGDKLLDWGGTYNLYTHCNAAYGGWNDVRKPDPNNILGLERLAYVTGATADFTGRPVLADVQTPGTSAFREAAIVYTGDLNKNNGKPFSTTPGHFENFICTSD